MNQGNAKQAPQYEWICQDCKHANASGTRHCERCACPARFKVTDLTLPQQDESDLPSMPVKNRESVWIFFPELLFAAGVLLYAPIWAVRALADGKTIRGLAILILGAAAIASFAVLWNVGQRRLASIATVILSFAIVWI